MRQLLSLLLEGPIRLMLHGCASPLMLSRPYVGPRFRLSLEARPPNGR